MIRDARYKRDIKEFVDGNPNENLYMSVYQFAELTQSKPVYDSAITDKIFIDLDSDGHATLTNETWRDLQVLLDWCKKESTEERPLVPQIFFSGGSGYHVIFTLSRPFLEIKDPKIVQHLTKKIRENSGSNAIDLQANNGFTQLRRIPNTQHQRTKLYCIPLSLDEAYNYEPLEILRIAQKPRKGFKVNTSKSIYFDEVISFVRRLSENPSLRKKLADKKNKLLDKRIDYIEKQGLAPIRTCIQKLFTKENPTFQERTWIAAELLRCNYGGRTDTGGYETIHLHQIFRNFDKYDYGTSEYHFKKMIDKGLYAPSCKMLQEVGLCTGH